MIRFYVVLLAGILLVAETGNAQDVVVVDGLGGSFARNMQPEVDRLQQQGFNVTYRPWWKWRSAARSAPEGSRIIGYSMGGPRAIKVAQRINASQLELVDPVSIKPMYVPRAVGTTVYRASEVGRINSTAVYGDYQQFWIPTNHIGMPSAFRF